MRGVVTLSEPDRVTTPAVPNRRLSAWKVATSTCPHCVGEGQAEKAVCGPCGGTGDLLRAMLEEQRRKGREEGAAALRGLYSVLVETGRYVRDLPMPDVRSEAGW